MFTPPLIFRNRNARRGPLVQRSDAKPPHHLNYADVAARNAPIGSGSMESACGQFQDRLKRRGQFWSPSGLAHMLDIDIANKNDTLEFLWN